MCACVMCVYCPSANLSANISTYTKLCLEIFSKIYKFQLIPLTLPSMITALQGIFVKNSLYLSGDSNSYIISNSMYWNN